MNEESKKQLVDMEQLHKHLDSYKTLQNAIHSHFYNCLQDQLNALMRKVAVLEGEDIPHAELQIKFLEARANVSFAAAEQMKEPSKQSDDKLRKAWRARDKAGQEYNAALEADEL